MTLGRPRQPGDRMGYRRNGNGGRDHEADGEQRDVGRRLPQRNRGEEVGLRVQQRRQEQQEERLGVERRPVEPGNEGQQQPREHEHDRVRDAQPARQLREQRHDREQADDRLDVRRVHDGPWS
jgi:hypothetical protein